MSNKSTIFTGVTLYIGDYKEMERLRMINDTSRSRFIQTALRNHIKFLKEKNISEFINNLDDREFQMLKDEIKKRS